MCIPSTSDNCASPNFSPCIRYELDLPEFSAITKTCVNLEDTTKDIYTLIGEIKEEIPENLIETIETIESQIATLQAQVLALQQENICLKDITSCVDIEGLDPCSEPITNLGQVLNYILNRLDNP